MAGVQEKWPSKPLALVWLLGGDVHGGGGTRVLRQRQVYLLVAHVAVRVFGDRQLVFSH